MGDDDDKPFVCNVSGCTMKFVNEDHLTVHKKKHEMSLSLNTPNIFQETFVDQTPTPTKLLKNCQDLGLFQDLGIQPNPFDEQFRKATQSGTATVSSSATIGLEQDSLNTPSVPPLTSDVTLPVVITSTSHVDMLETSCNIPRPSTILPEPEPASAEETMPFDPGSASCDQDMGNSIVVEEYDLADMDNQTVPAVIIKSPKEVGQTIRNIVPRKVVQMPVITSVATLRQNQQALLKPKAPMAAKQVVLVTKAMTSTTSAQPVITVAAPAPIPATTTVIQPAPATSSSGVASTTTNAPMIQLIVKLDGQSMPFNIPLPALASNVPTTRIVGSPNTLTVQPSAVISTSARDVLKGAVEEKMNRKGVPLVVNAVNSMSGGSQAQLLGPKHHNTIGTINPNNPVAAVQPTVRNNISAGRKRKEYDEDDPQEKRRRFLERNRAAATRCRLKKKKWVDELETKCKELTDQNNQLLKEVAFLRNEVANLKTLLLAHKDCPVTQQQMKTNGQQQVFPLSALTTVCASSVSSPQRVTSLRTVESGSHMSASPVLLETIHLDEPSDEDDDDDDDIGSMDNSNDGSVAGASEY